MPEFLHVYQFKFSQVTVSFPEFPHVSLEFPITWNIRGGTLTIEDTKCSNVLIFCNILDFKLSSTNSN